MQLGNLTALLAKIRPAVEATHYTGERSAKNYAFVDAVARTERVTDYRQHSGKEPCASGPRIRRQHKDCRFDAQPGNGNRGALHASDARLQRGHSPGSRFCWANVGSLARFPQGRFCSCLQIESEWAGQNS